MQAVVFVLPVSTVPSLHVALVVSGVTAFLHARAKTKPALAVFGALTGISALAALFLGVLLHS